jgi:hypothetical protein
MFKEMLGNYYFLKGAKMASHYIKYIVEVVVTEMDGTPEESADIVGAEILGTIEEFTGIDTFKIVAVDYYDYDQQ